MHLYISRALYLQLCFGKLSYLVDKNFGLVVKNNKVNNLSANASVEMSHFFYCLEVDFFFFCFRKSLFILSPILGMCVHTQTINNSNHHHRAVEIITLDLFHYKPCNRK